MARPKKWPSTLTYVKIYFQENAALLAKKDNLEKRIQQMKKSIALEKKRLSEINYSCGQLQNNTDLTEERYR